jgi:2-dehydro-3-deoxyphosphooctonate aldolase (KDO 8-P synthase)
LSLPVFFRDGRVPLALIAGPCVIESEEHVHRMARCEIRRIAAGRDFVFKASFDKANRTSLKGYRGPGLRRAAHSGGLRSAGFRS